MVSDEQTQLLAADSRWPEESAWKSNETSLTGRTFAAWQIGAFFGILLAYADTSLVWATHETIASHFNTVENSSWMMTSFTIGYCVTLPLYGRLSDNYGRLRPIIAAYSIFCIGCTLCGIGQAFWQVIVGRIVTGCGASGIVSLVSIIITDIAPPSHVAVLRSYVNVASTVGLSLGGPLGGFLSGAIGWRWSFLGQVPFSIGCCVLLASARGLRQSKSVQGENDAHRPIRSENEINPEALAFDYPGVITLATGVSSLLVAIDLQNRFSWKDPLLLSLITVGALSIAAFVVLEIYPGNRELLIPLRLLKTEIGSFCAGQILVAASCHGLVTQIAPYFARTQGASDMQAGAQTIAVSVGNAVGNLIAGQIIRKFGRYKRLSLISLSLFIANSLLIVFQWSHRISTWEALTTFPYGIFGGIVLSTQFIGLYICAPKQYMATAISMYYMSQQLGIAVGISISSTLLKQEFKVTLQKMLVNIPGHDEIIKKIFIDSSIVALLPAGVLSLVRQSYINSFWVVPALAALFQVLAIIPMSSTTDKPSE